MGNQRIKTLTRDLGAASTYASWREIAEELDDLEGGSAWRAEEASSRYDSAALKAAQAELLRRTAGPAMALADHLHVSLHRHLAEITHRSLYTRSRVGTKHLIEGYLTAVVQALDHLCDAEIPELTDIQRRQVFEREAKNVGRSALLLSGGATLGLFHIGVVKALWEQELLPVVVSGASTGSMIAGGLCTRTDPELTEVFSDPATHIDTRVFRLLTPSEMRGEGVVMSRTQLLETICANMGDLTFGESFERTGRVLCMSVSPTRARQKPRLLCHVTAPDVLVTSASMASCAIPALFPPSTLLQRRGGEVSEYVPGERWIDGTVQSDLPTERLARLLNVNHTIVSQTNAHVLPFSRARNRSGTLPLLTDLVSSSAWAQGKQLLSVARRHARRPAVKRALDHVWGIADQRAMGDITILPRVTAWNLGVVLRNASPAALERLILQGERATWPHLHVIEAQTRISRALAACVRRLSGP